MNVPFDACTMTPRNEGPFLRECVRLQWSRVAAAGSLDEDGRLVPECNADEGMLW